MAHHNAHAAPAFLWSGLVSAAVLIADGRGEDTYLPIISIYLARGNELKPNPLLSVIYLEHLLVLFYQSVGDHCGFGRYDFGKTMVLACYGCVGTRSLLSGRDDDLVTSVPPCGRASVVHRS